MANPTRPEPMNATTHHPKVNVTLTLAEPYFIAGEYISGKMEMDCKADKGLGIGVMMIELFAIQELTSRDHSARSTFIHARRLFQGPGLPASNAVQAHPIPGDPPLPLHYHQARRGHSTFLFRLPLPATSPSSISFGSGLASVKYEVRASVGVSWKGERQLVTDKKDAEVVEAYDEDRIGKDEPEVTVVGENGKIWCQARLIGGVLVAGESACVELQVKNHSAKKNTGLSIALNRSLYLTNVSSDEEPLQINDTVTTVPFRGLEYIIPPGVEGVASLVFDVPKRTKGVRGGLLIGDESEALGKKSKGPRLTQGLFEVNCVVAVKMTMGLGNKDILVEIPVIVVHPSVLPKLSPPEQYPGYPYYDYGQAHAPYLQSSLTPFLPAQLPYTAPAQSPYASHPALPMSPGPAYVDSNQNLVWFPPLSSSSSEPYHHPEPYYYHPLQYPVFENNLASAAPIPRPSSASALPGLPSSPTHDLTSMFGSAGPLSSQQTLPPLPGSAIHRAPSTVSKTGSVRYGGIETDIDGEEGTGQRASRIAQTLRISSQAQRRGRSVSPAGGHRYPFGTTSATIGGPPISSVPRATLAPLPQIDTTSFTSAPLHSPRPVLSPKRSYTNITTVSADGGGMVSKSITKSERVEELERMADELGSKTKNLTGDLPDEPPPVPTMTDKVKLVAKAKTRAAVEDYFSSVPPMNQSTPAVVDISRNRNLKAPSVPIPPPHRSRSRSRTPPTPATPTLTAVATPSKSKLNGQTTKGLLSLGVPGGGGGRMESGLDALERKLLAEVGTRKVVDDKRPDVWTVLGGDKKASRSPTDKPSPISIPRRDSDRDPLNDSAISSLTLPDCGDINSPINQNLNNTHNNLHGTNAMDLERDRDSDEKTHRGGLSGKKRKKDKKTASKGTLKDGMALDGEEHEKDKERKNGRKKGKERSSAAKGRVAAWLGGVEAEPPLDDVIASSPSPSPANVELSYENFDTAQPSSSSKLANDEPSAPDLLAKDNEVGSSSSPIPHPRSSGFVPIGNLKRDIYQRTLVPKDSPVASTNPTDDARRITDIWSRHGNTIENVAEGAWQSVTGKGNYSLLPPMKSDPEVKYDIRSARGGKGGRVTAVAAIWASGAAGPVSNKPTTSPLSSGAGVGSKEKVISPAKIKVSSPFSVPKFPISASSSSSSTSNDGVNVRRVTSTKLGVQVSSVPIPAVISSSHAKPTLSTTASLARPSATGATKGLPVKVPPTISELPSEAKVGSSKSSGAAGKPTGTNVGGKGNNLSSVVDPGSVSRSPPSTVGEHLAFGQARLRDLIKKYQGQTAS